MKIKQGYILRSVAGSNIIVPVNDPTFKKIISLNDTGAFLFNKLLSDTDPEKLCDMLADEYEVDVQTAETDVEKFIEALRQAGLLDE